MTSEQPIFVAVHGVGRQLELATLRTLIEGSHLVRDSQSKFTRAQLDDLCEKHGGMVLDETGHFAEVRYSHLIDSHASYSERDLKQWISTIKGRPERIHGARTNERLPDFSQVELVVEDILLATKVAKFLGERLKVKEISFFESSAQDFLQQLQLFVDRPSYRRSIQESVKEQLEGLASSDPSRRLVLVTHSLGTVVTFIAILNAQKNNEPWLAQVDRFITFGSPLDLFLVLFEEFFPPVSLCDKNIGWTNYTLLNDPIATDLKIVSQSFLKDKAPGLFSNNKVHEIVLGAGSIATAHTEYWHHLDMLSDIYEPKLDPELGPELTYSESQVPAVSKETEVPISTERRDVNPTFHPHGSGFLLLGLVAILVSGWVALVWWEENLKVNDADRVVILDRGPFQVAVWFLFALMIGSHAIAWSCSLTTRILGILSCLATSAVLYFLLPPLSLFGGPSASSSNVSKKFGTELIFFPNYHVDVLSVLTGNTILLLVPLAALAGLLFVRGRLGIRKVSILLAVLIVSLSLFVGTRTNPSNVTEEFGILSLAFGFWLLAILLFRLHKVYRDYVCGRKHIDMLHELWKPKQCRSEIEGVI
jgi:hypothetical protein